MRNMKAICIKLTCFLLVLFMSSAVMAESITSPNGQLQLNFSVNSQGEPVYELFYKGKAVIKPSKLGLELKNDPGLMNGLLWPIPKRLHSTKHGNRCGVR